MWREGRREMEGRKERSGGKKGEKWRERRREWKEGRRKWREVEGGMGGKPETHFLSPTLSMEVISLSQKS